MPSLDIQPRKVAGVITECNRALMGQGFNQAEVMIGLAELLGRLIVEVSKGPTQTEELMRVTKEHLDDTVSAGLAAKGIIPLTTPE